MSWKCLASCRSFDPTNWQHLSRQLDSAKVMRWVYRHLPPAGISCHISSVDRRPPSDGGVNVRG